MSYKQRPQARVALTWLRALRRQTKCEHCGRKPIEWHGDHSGKRRNYRPIAMAARGLPIWRISQEIARCRAFCRRCHMRHDGRDRQNAGELNAHAKLTWAKAGRMRRLRAGGWLLRELADEFKVDQSTCSSVVRGLAWVRR